MTLFQSPISGPEEIAVKVANSAATVIVDGTDGAWFVPWLQVNENAGGTSSLTIELNDGSVSYYLGSGGVTWKAKPMTAAQSVAFSEGIVVPRGWQLIVTSSDAAGKLDVVGTKIRRLV